MRAHERGTPDNGDLGRVLARIRAGDEEAARELLVRYEAQVRLVVRRQLPRLLRSRFDSLDFLQSVWGSFFRRMRAGPAEFAEPENLVAFLARAAKNKVIDEYRRASSRKQDMRIEEPIWEGNQPRELSADLATASDVAEAREVFAKLRELLPEDRRIVLDWKASGLTNREIGVRLGLSERTIRRLLEDLRRRARFESEGRE
jgi:RNA polymerase sigma-70 factor (ECF subfamily)